MTLADMLGQFLSGTWISIQILVISSVAGTALAVPLALARISRWLPLRTLSFVWSGFFRGTPLLVQLFLFYYGLAQFDWIRGSSFWPLNGLKCVTCRRLPGRTRRISPLS